MREGIIGEQVLSIEADDVRVVEDMVTTGLVYSSAKLPTLAVSDPKDNSAKFSRLDAHIEGYCCHVV